MLEYIAALVGMHETDKILLARAEVKESNKTAIVQMSVQSPDQLCSYKDYKKIKECFDAKSKLQEKTPDPYQDMWNRDWINNP